MHHLLECGAVAPGNRPRGLKRFAVAIPPLNLLCLFYYNNLAIHVIVVPSRPTLSSFQKEETRSKSIRQKQN